MLKQHAAKNRLKNCMVMAGILLFIAGCSNTRPSVPPPPPQEKKQIQNNAQKDIVLLAKNFPGRIIIHANTVQETDNGFSIPVFVSNVTEKDGLDTVALQLTLLGNERLSHVQTSRGFTAQLDGVNTKTPTIYYLPSALSPDAYTPVVAQKDPVFTLFFTGKKPKKMHIKGSFFVVNGTLFRTSSAILSLQ